MKKKKEVEIKRERYRKKYYMVLRENNKVVERIPWGSRPKPFGKKINKRKAVDNYKQNKSIYDDRTRTTGKNWKFIEETRRTPTNYKKLKDKPPKIKKRNKQRYMYFIEGVIEKKSGKSIPVVAASQQHDPDYPIEKAREEAIESFYQRCHFIYSGSIEGNYDADEGLKLVETGKIEVKNEGVKYYLEK